MRQNNSKRPAVAADVAKRAGVSPSTVSRVFDPKWEGRIRPETKEKILAAAAEMGYTPNAIARSLNANRTDIVAVVVGELVGYFYSEIFFKLVGQIQQSGKQVLVFVAKPEQGVERIVRQVHQYRVDAIIIMSNATSTYIENYFMEYGTPVILFNREATDSRACSVCSDIHSSIRQAVRFLVENGHRRLAYVSGDNHGADELERTQSFLKSAREFGAEITHNIAGDYSFVCGYQAAQKILREEKKTDAIFCNADTMALGAIDGVRALGLDVPSTISVMGFDNNSVGRLPAYSLTTVNHPQEKLLDATIQVLTRVLENREHREDRLLAMDLVTRSSVRLLKSSCAFCSAPVGE